MSIITVGSSADLNKALASAADGDTILLKAGVYSDVSIRNVRHDESVTVKSLDPEHQAVITDLQIRGAEGFSFSDIEVSVTGASTPSGAIGVFNSENINFDRIYVHGSLDENSQNDTDGFRIKDSEGVSVTNSEFQQLRIAIGHGDSRDLNFSGNHIVEISLDGIRGGGSSQVTISNNYFSNFTQKAGDHADAIQFYPSDKNLVVKDIVVDGNIIVQGDGQEIQGIFLRNLGESLFQNVIISQNMLIGGNHNGIFVEGAIGVRLVGNSVVSLDGEASWIRIVRVEDAVLEGNSAVKFMLDPDSDIASIGNVVNGTVGDMGASALKSWLAKEPQLLDGMSFASLNDIAQILKKLPDNSVVDTSPGDESAPIEVPPLTLPSPEVEAPHSQMLLGDAGDNTLVGGAGDDVLVGGGGKDVLDGGLGSDTASYESFGGGVTVSLTRWNGEDISTTFQSIGMSSKQKLISIENITGSNFNDTLTGNLGENVLKGGTGNDLIIGKDGADSLYGGSGADTFQYSSISESTVAPAGRDTIFDFRSGEGDKINLRPIDAVEGADRNENFKLVANFTKVAGQLTVGQEGDHWVVQGDVNGDGVADFAINVVSTTPLAASDFIL